MCSVYCTTQNGTAMGSTTENLTSYHEFGNSKVLSKTCESNTMRDRERYIVTRTYVSVQK